MKDIESSTRIAVYYSRKRNRKQKWREFSAKFEAASVGDLAFLLLIFFIVTSSFILRQGIFLSLPAKNAGTMSVDAKTLINIYPTSESFRINNQEYDRDQLKTLLTKKKNENEQLVVVIFMKKEIAYNRLIDTLSAAKECGISKFSLRNIL